MMKKKAKAKKKVVVEPLPEYVPAPEKFDIKLALLSFSFWLWFGLSVIGALILLWIAATSLWRGDVFSVFLALIAFYIAAYPTLALLLLGAIIDDEPDYDD